MTRTTSTAASPGTTRSCSGYGAAGRLHVFEWKQKPIARLDEWCRSRFACPPENTDRAPELIPRRMWDVMGYESLSVVRNSLYYNAIQTPSSGRGGIRTHAGRCPHDFQSCALSHSATRPDSWQNRGARIRTGDLCDPNAALYRTEPRPVPTGSIVVRGSVPERRRRDSNPHVLAHAAFRVRCLTN